MPASTQKAAFATFLQQEIRDGLVYVFEDGSGVRVRILTPPNMSMFASGKADLDSGYYGLMSRIADAIEKYKPKGTVRVQGYTDSVAISTVRFPDNIALSQARADSVANQIKEHLSDPSRLVIEGFGAQNAIAPNDKDHRALNRRVEIVVPPGDR